MADAKDSDETASPLNSFTQRRAPSKRKIRAPEQLQEFQFNFTGSDSEDDEDFVASSEEQSSDESQDGREREGLSQEGSSDFDDDDDYDANNDDANNDDDDDDEDEQREENTSIKNSTSFINTQVVQGENRDTQPESSVVRENGTTESSAKSPIKVDVRSGSAGRTQGKSEVSGTKSSKSAERIVCGICLESESTEEDELVECDNCGITVHEGCYGDAEDSIAESKSDSDVETEPWFCDACKANANGICELCPNKGGIMKQTETGKWVHLVCALYVPGTGFQDVDRLQTVVLEDINPSRWGARRCMLCDDQRFSRTGVCIGCDAGLCKNFFHAMCAQKHGLLIEIPDAGLIDDDEVDPLFAHCKMHTDKNTMKKRKNRWLSFQSHVENFRKSDNPEDKARLETAFEKAKEDYHNFFSSLPLKADTTNKPRLLTTCPEACEKLTKKAELIGFSSISEEIHEDLLPTGNIARGGAIYKPNLSNGFINHFFKREKWLQEYDVNHKKLQDSIQTNQAEQKVLQESWDSMKLDLENLASGKTWLVSQIMSIHTALEKLADSKLTKPAILKPKKRLKKEPEAKLEEFIHICATCDKTENQQLMAQCDTCYHYYHIHCLDPPLTHLPKKGPKWVWQCTNCDQSESEESIDLDEPMMKRKRRNRVAPQKFTPVDEEKKECKRERKSANGKKRGRPRKVRNNSSDSEATSTTTSRRSSVSELPVTTPRRQGRKKTKVVETFDDCIVCSEAGDGKKMVRCDECKKCYHFDCCTPKLRGNPKIRGYSWICTDCTEKSDEEDNNEDNDEDDDEDYNVHNDKEMEKQEVIDVNMVEPLIS